MPPNSSDRQRAQLTIPNVPKFPFSSPITEEIASPTSSSSEDREMERNRPFEFLAKVSSRNPLAHRADHDKTREDKQGAFYSTEGRGRGDDSSTFYTGRKNTERPVGLNLDIPKANANQRKGTTAAFVDLNDLKVLSKAREEERTTQKFKGILKKGDTGEFQRLPDDLSDSGGRKRASLLGAGSRSPKKKFRDDGISPTDRPIVIGFSVPYSESPKFQDEKQRELDSAGTQQTPLTPSIIVTPAKEDSFWNYLSPENARPRPASSVYSQPTPYPAGDQSNVPPVPAVPALYSTANESEGSEFRLSLSVDSVRKRRSFSTGAVNENEKGENLQPAGRSRSHSNEQIGRPSDRLTINTTLNTRASQGWWNYLLSPLLSRTSTLLSRNTPTETTRPPIPTIEPQSTGLTDEWWEEKEISYFSPDTPDATEAARNRIAGRRNADSNPFADFDWSIDEQPENTRDREAASMMFSGQRIQGAAAEYYQACAHELFSGTPYFECINHVCSITPKHKVPTVNFSPPLSSTQSAKALLIDVDDMPRSINLESPKSGVTSITSSPSDEASVISRGFRTSLKSSSQAPPSEKMSETPKISSPIPNRFGDPGQLDSPPEKQYENQPTNPFLQQPREAPAPVTNVHVQSAAPPPPPNIHIESAAAPPPANIHIQTPAAQPPPNFYYQPPIAPPIPEAPMAPMAPAAPAPTVAPVAPAASAAPPTRPSIAMPYQEQIPPPTYGAQPRSTYPSSPESLQEATGRGGSIRLSGMPAGPAPAYTPHDNSAALPPRPVAVPITREALAHPVTERDRIENRRRRHEREEAIGRRAGGWWRGRGPFSNKGCFGRPGREGRLKRRWYLAIFIFFLAIVVCAVLLAIFLTRRGDNTPVQSQWLNLTGYPPMPTGISTIAGPEAQVQNSGCINPSYLWSCALPEEQHSANEPYAANQPNFRVEIRFQNGTYDRSTALASRSFQMLAPRSANQLFNPSPYPPSINEQSFLGKTTDNNSVPYEGEETPFYITVLSAEPLSSSQLSRRSDSNDSTLFPDIASLIPSPSVDSDGTAAPAVLHPFPSSQPVRLYNRDKDDEHYGFYTYFDKSIFLDSMTPLNGHKEDNANNTNGGSTKADARVRCTWAQTRFLVQIWTKPEQSGKRLVDRQISNNTATSTTTATATSTSQPTSSSSATDFTRPGSFPYPITVTLDRHGGTSTKKMVYCYGMEADQHINGTEKKLQVEDRGFNGQVVNPAPGLFNISSSNENTRDDEGGYDGGTGGCSCQWVNWVGMV